jgi:beta-glucanase (GH16 family)
MKVAAVLSAVILILSPQPASAAASGGDHHPRGFTLVFGDEFTGSHLDRHRWCTRYQYDGGPALQVPAPWCLGEDPSTHTTLGTLDTLGPAQEQEVYRDFNVDGDPMHTVQHGHLSLHATATRPGDDAFPYESAMIRSNREFQPRANHPLYLTARLRMPDVIGTWPAFWLAGGYGDGTVRPPWPPEIDILEGPYNRSGMGADVWWTAVQTYCDEAECPQGPVEVTYADPAFDGNAYHAPASLKGKWIEIGLLWYPDSACWYIDGRKVACKTYKWVANEGPAGTTPATILLNLAVGGPWAGADGVELTEAGATYDIDHVRVYRQ